MEAETAQHEAIPRQSCCGDGLKSAQTWQGLTVASPLPAVQSADSAEAAPEPEAAQGAYDPHFAEAPLSLPLVEGGAGVPSREPMELLAPAGGLDAGYAAFHYGADAIYLGLKKFSARAEAENFTLDDVDAITSFAHASSTGLRAGQNSARVPPANGRQDACATPARRRRVFVTLNTLVLQRELSELVEALGTLAEIGVDALIVQDLGVYAIARRYFPELELHASTQLAVHNRAGAEALKAMGFKRVVLARELTLEEVRDITSAAGIETEVFIHGALCYSYSGLCLFSAQTLGRSGNRGKCAYSCRDEFQVSSAPETLRDGSPVQRSPNAGFAFSMKDLALPDHLPALRAAGVSCVKIEGRKKSPLYVATTTDYYRKLLDGSLAPEDRPAQEADMQTVFSRPWTRLFVQDHRFKEVADRDTVGHRGAPIGSVEAVIDPGSETPLLRFKTARALERHDGLQIDVPGLGQPFGFAVERMFVGSTGVPARATSTFEAPAGATVEVAMPEEHPPIPVGAKIYCSSSQDVKRRYRHARPKPGQFRARREIDVSLVLSAAELRATVRVRKNRPAGVPPVVRAVDRRDAGGTIAGPRAGPPLDDALHATGGDATAYAFELQRVLRGPLKRARDAGAMAQAARGAFEKLGETRLSLGTLSFENPEKLFVPLSSLNQLRRELCEAAERRVDAELNQRIEAVKAEVCLGEFVAQASGLRRNPEDCATGDFQWSIKVDRIGFLDSFSAADYGGLDEAIVDIARDQAAILGQKLEALAERIGREKIRLALPAVTRKWEERGLLQKIELLGAAGWNKWEAANLSAWPLLDFRFSIFNFGLSSTQPRFSPDIGSVVQSKIENRKSKMAADWSVYAVNRAAARQVLAMGAERFALSPEDGLENMRPLLREFGPRATVIVHQDTPLFIAESCAYANLIGGCPGKANCRFESMDMISSHGEKVTAIDYHCRTIVLNRGPFCLAPRLKELRGAGAVSLRADFIHRKYEPNGVREAWRLVRAGKNVPGGHAANFERGLL